MNPVDALNEIAFWLDRELAPSFKVQAFRKAAAIIGPTDPAELAACLSALVYESRQADDGKTMSIPVWGA